MKYSQGNHYQQFSQLRHPTCSAGVSSISPNARLNHILFDNSSRYTRKAEHRKPAHADESVIGSLMKYYMSAWPEVQAKVKLILSQSGKGISPRWCHDRRALHADWKVKSRPGTRRFQDAMRHESWSQEKSECEHRCVVVTGRTRQLSRVTPSEVQLSNQSPGVPRLRDLPSGKSIQYILRIRPYTPRSSSPW